MDKHLWRYIFWCGVPLLIGCLAMVLFGLSGKSQYPVKKIDSIGALLAAIASSTLIIAFSLPGMMYSWTSVQVIGLLTASIVFWMLFLKAEAGAEEPIVDLQVLKNRTFITIICACILSSFGMTGLTFYYPMLMQGVQHASARWSGVLMTPGNVLMNFMGVAAGFILARTKRYKWMFLLGYGLTAVTMIALIWFNADTPMICGFVAFTLAGMGMGSIPTLNTLIAQYAVPRRLMGVATGALYFSVLIGMAISPAILGSAMNTKYNSTLNAALPNEMHKHEDGAIKKDLSDSAVLLSEEKMASLRAKITGMGSNGQSIWNRTESAISLSMEAGLKVVYIIGAVAMVLTFLIICALPKITIDTPVEDNKAP